MNNETNNKTFVCEKNDQGFSLNPSFFNQENNETATEMLDDVCVFVPTDTPSETDNQAPLDKNAHYIPSEQFKEALFTTHHFVREHTCYSEKPTSSLVSQTPSKGSILSLLTGAALLFLTYPALGLLFCLSIMTLWIWKQDDVVGNAYKHSLTALDMNTFEQLVQDTALLQNISGTEALISDLKRVYTQPLSQKMGETLHSHIKKMLCIISDDLRKTHLKNDTQQILNTILNKDS